MTYREFLEERRRRIATVIRDAFTSLLAGTEPEPGRQPTWEPTSPALDGVPTPGDADDAETGLAPRHLLRREFWRAFMLRAAGRAPLPSRLRQGTNSSIYVPTAEKKRLYWEYSIRMHDAGIDLAIYQSDAASTKRMFDQLFAQRAEIESVFGATLDWDRRSQGHESYIRHQIAGAGLLQREAWPEIQERMIVTMAQFQ
jgi:hypothetical protein